MSPLLDDKAWATCQARAALAGVALMRSTGTAGTVVVAIDVDGRPHRIERADDLDDLLHAAESRA